MSIAYGVCKQFIFVNILKRQILGQFGLETEGLDFFVPMLILEMPEVAGLLPKGFTATTTVGALVRPLPCVLVLVFLLVQLQRETLRAVSAFKGLDIVMEGVMVPFPSIGVRELVRATLVLAMKPFSVVSCLLSLGSRWLQDSIQNLVNIIMGCLWLDFVIILYLGWHFGIFEGRWHQFLTTILL